MTIWAAAPTMPFSQTQIAQANAQKLVDVGEAQYGNLNPPEPTAQPSFEEVMAELSKSNPLIDSAASLSRAAAQDTASSRAFGFSELGVFGADAAVDDAEAAEQAPISASFATASRASTPDLEAAAGMAPLAGLNDPSTAGGPSSTLSVADGRADPYKIDEAPISPETSSALAAVPEDSLPSSAYSVDEVAESFANGSDEPSETATPTPFANAAAMDATGPQMAEASVIVSNAEGVLHILMGAPGLSPTNSTKIRRVAQDIASAYSLKVGSLRLNGADLENSTPAERGEVHANFSC